MKRKLDANNEPAPAPETEQTEPPTADAKASAPTNFADFALDPLLLQAIASQKWKQPTLVQSKAIPLALEGHDVLAKAKTGSGKTGAYLLPVFQSILTKRKKEGACTRALVLVPTRELADQVTRECDTFSGFCKGIRTLKLSDKLDAAQRTMLSEKPDIVVATPTRAWKNIKDGALSLAELKYLVLDEADLVLSYGYEEDVQNIAGSMPKGVQSILMSATLTTDVHTVKGLLCQNPTVLDLEEGDVEGGGVAQFVVKCAEADKFLLTYLIYKLKLLTGKSIVFTADIDRCYRLKLFLEQFGIRSCVLNSELPVNSRIHIVHEFNSGIYDIIIASDENEVVGDEEAPQEDATEKALDDTKEEKAQPKDKTKAESENPPKKKRKQSRRDKEYGISRGIDFKNVACVINLDLPTSSKSYTHRIGRTARAGKSGTALSFVIPAGEYGKHKPTSVHTAENDEKVLARIRRDQGKKGKEVKDYNFDMKQASAFRYRVNDALRAVTKVAIREARVRELKQELLKSEKLTRFYEENPAELRNLARHDGELRTARTQAHLKHVPEYLLPSQGKAALTSNNVGFVPFKKEGGKTRKGRTMKGRKGIGRRVDPLKSFRGKPKSRK